MKRIQVFTAILASTLIAGCADIYNQPHGYYDYDYYNKDGHHAAPNTLTQPLTDTPKVSKHGKRKPHPYSVTPHDQAKFDSLNNRIQGRVKQVQTTPTDASKVAPSSAVTKTETADDTQKTTKAAVSPSDNAKTATTPSDLVPKTS
jgi:hypothetical protein